jgi:hypothetical protein
MRNYLDPRRFYKAPDKMKAILHVGTVIEGPSEYKAGKLNKKERQQTIADEVLYNRRLNEYSKRKYGEIQAEKSDKRKMYKKGKPKVHRDQSKAKVKKLY